MPSGGRARGVAGHPALFSARRHSNPARPSPGGLEEVERAEGVSPGEGDLLVFRTGHHRHRLELGPWDNE